MVLTDDSQRLPALDSWLQMLVTETPTGSARGGVAHRPAEGS